MSTVYWSGFGVMLKKKFEIYVSRVALNLSKKKKRKKLLGPKYGTTSGGHVCSDVELYGCLHPASPYSGKLAENYFKPCFGKIR